MHVLAVWKRWREIYHVLKSAHCQKTHVITTRRVQPALKAPLEPIDADRTHCTDF